MPWACSCWGGNPGPGSAHFEHVDFDNHIFLRHFINMPGVLSGHNLISADPVRGHQACEIPVCSPCPSCCPPRGHPETTFSSHPPCRKCLKCGKPGGAPFLGPFFASNYYIIIRLTFLFTIGSYNRDLDALLPGNRSELRHASFCF